MRIRDVFATRVSEKIEPVVKVANRAPEVVYSELANLVVTPQWERHLHRVLDAYVDAADRENEQGIGIWISGFFGSGKSLLMKILGVLLECGELQGQLVHDLFLSRLPATSQDRSDIERFLTVLRRKITTTAVGGNLHSRQVERDDHLPLIAYRIFSEHYRNTKFWPFAWTVENQIEAAGLTDIFRSKVEEITGLEWSEIADDPEIHLESLYSAAVEVLPAQYSDTAAVDRTVNAISRSGIDTNRLIDRLRSWCEARDADGRRHKLLLQLDELGQWIAAGNANDRTMQVQSLVEAAAERGRGRIWVSVTAHGDIQALRQNVQQEYYAKIIQRFDLPCRLSNEDISQVVEKRVLHKTQAGRTELARRFQERTGVIVDLGSVERAQRVYPDPSAGNFPLFYPYLPWTVSVIPDVVKGIAQAANRDEALTGSNRTMIGVVQGGLIESGGPLDASLGRLISLADLYRQLEDDVPVETKTDLRRIRETVPDATDLTRDVAYGLFLLGQAQYIPTTLDNVARAVATDLETPLSSLRNRAKPELERLVAAGYAKQVGDQYVFLNTQQRTFQDKVRARQEELTGRSYDLSQALRDYESDNAFRFERVPIAGRELPVKVELDGRTIRNPSGAQVAVHVFSPLQRGLDPQIGDDTAMRQRSAQQPDAIFLRMGEVQGLRVGLALAAATKEIADGVLQSASAGGEAEVARQARQIDLPELQTQARRMISQSMRAGVVFFRGTIYQLAAGNGPGEAVVNTLAQILPNIYPRYGEVTHRIANEQSAVRAALNHNTSNPDLQTLGVYRAGGELNQSHALLAALRTQLPSAEQNQEPVNAGELRRRFEAPPYGWDGNCVKAGLALLLRAAECRFIENGVLITDPGSDEAERILTNDARFRNARVQAVRSQLTPLELRDIRDDMRRLFSIPARVAVIASALNGALQEKLEDLARRGEAVHQWASTAQCPVPQDFLAAKDTVQELLNIGAAERRLIAFRDQSGLLERYIELLARLETFRNEQEERFRRTRDFYNGMVNAGADLNEVRTFLRDYRTLEQQRTLTEPERWNELAQSYQAAQAAVTGQIEAWRSQVQERLAALSVELEEAVRTADVPGEQVRDEAAALSALYDDVRSRLERDARTFGETRSLLAVLYESEERKNEALRELRARYAPQPPAGEKALTWRDLAPEPVHIASAEDLDVWLEGVRARVAGYLDDGKTVIIQ